MATFGCQVMASEWDPPADPGRPAPSTALTAVGLRQAMAAPRSFPLFTGPAMTGAGGKGDTR